MNVTFRRDDGREFVFEMPDGRHIYEDGKPYLDSDGYKSMNLESFMVVTHDESFVADLKEGQGGMLHNPFNATVPECEVKLVAIAKVRATTKLWFLSTVHRPIPSEDIKDWLGMDYGTS